MEALGRLSLSTILFLISILVRSFVYMKLWSWFIVYAFGVMEINFIQTVGLTFMWNYMRVKTKKDVEENTIEDTVQRFLQLILVAIFALSTAWVITLFQ